MIAPADTHFHLLEMRSRGIDIENFLESAFPKGAMGTGEAGHVIDGDAAPADALSFGLDIGLAADDVGERARLAEGHPGLFLSVGMFPGAVLEPDWRGKIAALDRSASASRVIAIGETGIDLHWKYGTLGEQIELFEGQIGCANSHGLPIVVHTRDADAETIETLRRIPPRAGGIIHCFSSGRETASRFIDAGFHISFAGNCTYPGARGIQEAAAWAPLDRILVETDAPYLAPQPIRGTVNTPLSIHHTYRFIAALRHIDANTLIEQVNRNIAELFGPRLCSRVRQDASP